MKTVQLKLISLLAVSVLCIYASALAAEHDYYGTLHYPKELVAGVGLGTVEQEGGPDATGYQRRTVQWCPTARTAAYHPGQSPAATVAAQANLRVVRHQFEGTSQAGNVGASHDEADVFDVDPLGKRAGCKVLEKELASFREKVEGRPA